MKSGIAAILFAISTISAHAETRSYFCKDHGKIYPLSVNEAQSTIEWKGAQYRTSSANSDNQIICAKGGWHATGNGTSFNFCYATQGGGYFATNDGEMLDSPICDLKQR